MSDVAARECLRNLGAQVGAIAFVLLEKGIVAEKEFESAIALVTSKMDQLEAEAEEKAIAAMGPIERMLYESLTGASRE